MIVGLRSLESGTQLENGSFSKSNKEERACKRRKIHLSHSIRKCMDSKKKKIGMKYAGREHGKRVLAVIYGQRDA